MQMGEKCHKKHPDIVSRKIADEVILVPIKRKLADVNSIYLLRDDVSIRIWELIDGERKLRQIKDIICKEFEVDPHQAEQDLKKFLKQLEKIGGIITEVDDRGEISK
ncbi:MAG: PqqD family protein [Elusimicrobia bacterium]|nr:MAG: PqqD family protein [Elusimicrobiota bacterium]